jgi:hypothetical protein
LEFFLKQMAYYHLNISGEDEAKRQLLFDTIVILEEFQQTRPASLLDDAVKELESR